MMEFAVGALYAVTVALKGPVVLGLLVVLAWSLWAFGAFLREAWERARSLSSWRAAMDAFLAAPDPDAAAWRAVLAHPAAPNLLRRMAADAATTPALRAEALLTDLEFAAEKRLSRLRLGLRAGPVLGLMGTLIPMGPALMSISRGDLSAMAEDLVIAFSTTVVGLLVGLLCYVMLTARRQWCARDLADAESMVRATTEARR